MELDLSKLFQFWESESLCVALVYLSMSVCYGDVRKTMLHSAVQFSPFIGKLGSENTWKMPKIDSMGV